MSQKKPSLYVLERKELIILVVLFLVATIAMFAAGVKYGKIVGKDTAMIEKNAKEEMVEHGKMTGHGGVGAAGHADSSGHDGGHADSHATTEKKSDAPADGHGAVHADSAQGDSSAGAPGDSEDAHGAGAVEDADSPEAMAMHSEAAKQAEKDASIPINAKDSDEVLLEALQKAGLDSKSADHQASLPEDEKLSALAGPIYVIQVGSFPTRSDAERQKNFLNQKNLETRVMDPVQQKNGTWYRVVMGQYRSMSAANSDAMKYKQAGIIKSYFVRKIN